MTCKALERKLDSLVPSPKSPIQVPMVAGSPQGATQTWNKVRWWICFLFFFSINIDRNAGLKLFCNVHCTKTVFLCFCFSVVPQTNVIVSGDAKASVHEESPLENQIAKWAAHLNSIGPFKSFTRNAMIVVFSIRGKEFPDISKVTQAQPPNSVLNAAHSTATGRMQSQSLFHTKLCNPLLKIVLGKHYLWFNQMYIVNKWTCMCK